MRASGLTPKQQLKVRAKVFKLLAAIGFQQDTGRSYGGYTYWWKRIPTTNQRICVGVDVPNQCLGGRTGWIWQQAKIGDEPLFGYSGSSSIGACSGTVERVLDSTLEQLYNAGVARGAGYERAKTKELREKLTAVLAS